MPHRLGEDPLNASLARAVAATAEIRVPLGDGGGSGGSGGGGGDQPAAGLVRFAIHAPVETQGDK